MITVLLQVICVICLIFFVGCIVAGIVSLFKKR